MGYTTYFTGQINVEPALNPQEIEFLKKFNETRRINRTKGPYFVDGSGSFGQGSDPDITNFNQPPEGQPSLWCQWTPTEDGTAIVWDEGEKFYESPEWMAYLIEHFLAPNPKALSELQFLQGHMLNGTISAQGEEPSDMWLLHVRNNVVSVEELVATPTGSERVIGGTPALPSK